MRTIAEYKNAALETLRGNWAPVVLCTLIFSLLGWTVGAILSIFLGGPLTIGYANSLRKLYENGDDVLTSNMFSIAFSKYLRKVWASLLLGLATVLGTVLLVVPGVIVSLMYGLVPFILEDCPDVSVKAAFTRSRTMMKGHKKELFLLVISFIGWFLLSLLTLGIGFFWSLPYAQTAVAVFYEDLEEQEKMARGQEGRQE